jgi:DNA (cytosine-5)-methyltransferase 1
VPNVLDIFCGAGGFSEGFKEVGFNILCGIDFENHKILTYRKNIKPSFTLKEDITKLRVFELSKKLRNQKIDIIIGSPPCKDFSNANPNKIDFDINSISSLHEHFFRFVVILSPDWFVLENVEGFFYTIEGEFFKKKFEPYGYTVKYLRLNSLDFGVPQNRIRGFLIGNRKNIDFSLEPTRAHPLTIEDAISDLVELLGEDNNDVINLSPPLSEYQRKLRNKNNTTINHNSTKHDKKTIEILAMINQGESAKNIEGLNINSKNSGAYYRPFYNEPARTITTRFDIPTGAGDSIHPILNRCFTAREAARLQSFNDNYYFFGNKKEVREQIGDAVPPLISKAIATRIAGFI